MSSIINGIIRPAGTCKQTKAWIIRRRRRKKARCVPFYRSVIARHAWMKCIGGHVRIPNMLAIGLPENNA